ncbi:MAG: zinc-finger domain-containing protein [Gammaproteobacteria bacterium]|nr:zinc-finger domain-containing protein [Gammaproteobacteria bacterium]MDH5630973.1 zinc-finger domain-containing protein [Gammaproteobacteria bacterium]
MAGQNNMSKQENSTKQSNSNTFKVDAGSLPVCCPPKEQEVWNQHPRVYLDLAKNGEANCPYCGNHFEMC